MKSGLRGLINFIYALLEQFVFLVAFVIGFMCWATFDNAYIAVSAFILICILFWAIPSLIRRRKK